MKKDARVEVVQIEAVTASAANKASRMSINENLATPNLPKHVKDSPDEGTPHDSGGYTLEDRNFKESPFKLLLASEPKMEFSQIANQVAD